MGDQNKREMRSFTFRVTMFAASLCLASSSFSMANAEQQNQNNNLRRLETDPDTELCPDGQLWCCAPTNPNAATYDLASTKGCMDLMSLGSQCEGYGAEFYRQLC